MKVILALACIQVLAAAVAHKPSEHGIFHRELSVNKGMKPRKKRRKRRCVADCPYNNYIDDVCMSSKMIADKAVHALFVDYNVKAARKLLAKDYIQHNPSVPTGAAPVLGLIPTLEEMKVGIEVHRTLEYGNLVAYHSTYTNADIFGAPTMVAFDVFRVEDGLVQEHWDNLQELSGPNPDGNTMTDGATMVKYRHLTEHNKDFVLEFAQKVLVDGDYSVIPEYISSEEYTQHNPLVADGLEGLAAEIDFFAEQGISLVYKSIDLVVAEGNFVLLGSLGKLGDERVAYYDLFRVQDGLIVEHWDVIQPVPRRKEFAHDNGKF